MSIPVVDIDVTDTALEFFCPACGAQVCGTEGFADSMCQHVLFTFLDLVGDLENVHVRLLRAAAQVKGKPNAVDLFLKLLKSKSAVVFNLNTVAGTGSHVFKVAIDFKASR